MAWHPFRNIGLKVGALGLGTLVFFTVSGPSVERTISGVPVIYRNVPASLEITDQTEEASVHVRGTDSQIRRLLPGDLVVEIDLAGERPGLVVLPLRTDQVTVPFGIEVTEVAPGAVTLTLEESAAVEVPVRPTIDGKPAAGFVEAGTKVDPATVTVVGPARRLKTTTAAITQRVSIEGARDTVSQTVTVGVIDPGLRLKEPRTARVTVRIEPVEDRTNERAHIVFRGLPKGRRAVAAPDAVAVSVRCPAAALSRLPQSAWVPFVDVRTLKIGDFTLPVHLDSIADCTASVTPATVAVRIR
ncbi:MAG TPA: CdaR family protein [Vicinamibacterales bacterium]|nr:CdaR family protein [Vicinamibacterales bacterium]